MRVGQGGEGVADSEEGAGEEREFVGAEVIANITKDRDAVGIEHGINKTTYNMSGRRRVLREIHPQLARNRDRINLHLVISQILLKYRRPERKQYDAPSAQTTQLSALSSHRDVSKPTS